MARSSSGFIRFLACAAPLGFWAPRNGRSARCLFLGFWNRKLGILETLGSNATFIATVTIIPFMPDGWDAAAGGFPAMTGNVPFLMKDVVLLATSLYLLTQDLRRELLSTDAGERAQRWRQPGPCEIAQRGRLARHICPELRSACEQFVLLRPVQRQIEFGQPRRGERDGLPALQDRLDQFRAQEARPTRRRM